tara:strand:+ start:127 stop:672 length:546 start_codon:yes stop_codon:yes gene_type:complete
MRNIELIRKFRPIFVFSKGEKHYPINKYFLKGKQGNIKIEDTQNITSPQEPLYYHLYEEDKEEIAVIYVLIFPYSMKGFFNLSGEKGDILSCLTVIDKRTKTLKEVYYWNNIRESFQMKTTRLVIYVTANDHLFKTKMSPEVTGLRWEPEKIEDFKLKNLKDYKLEGKYFDQFLKPYKILT